ncbi:hypothetical protein, partial [Klebsiella michiganensis]|uniref:hypothetical protein n=1 Tax=Klebsiella michiganensis TaxID=1134687 RepID=UPI001EDFA481
RYRPSLFRKGTQSAQGQAGRLYFLFAEHPHLRRSAKKRRTGKTCPLQNYAVARSFQESE